jgi:2-polyprenyl-6-methoxyphenol hydroxylase-like FAD-dependent oxidoreductase
MLPQATDVLIVGAGPTGLTLAAGLAQSGCDFVLVDRQETAANTSRAAVIHPYTLEMLEPLGVSEKLAERGHIVPRFSIRSRDSKLLTVDFSTLPTRYPFTLMLPQDETEAILFEGLEDLGGKVHRPFQATDFLEDADGVEVTLLDANGATSRIRAGYVVGADGMHSIVRQRARIPFHGSVYEESFILADVRMDWGLASEEVNLFFSPSGLVVVAPLPNGRHRIVATIDEAPSEPTREDVQALLDTRGPRNGAARVHDVIWSSRFRVHHRLAARYHQGRVVLAGDAAHVHSPAGGQGMNTGMVDARVLAPRLADIIAGRRDHEALDEYESMRMPVAKQVLAMSNRMTSVATLRDPAMRSLRNLGLGILNLIPPVEHSLAFNLSGLRHRRA